MEVLDSWCYWSDTAGNKCTVHRCQQTCNKISKWNIRVLSYRVNCHILWVLVVSITYSEWTREQCFAVLYKHVLLVHSSFLTDGAYFAWQITPEHILYLWNNFYLIYNSVCSVLFIAVDFDITGSLCSAFLPLKTDQNIKPIQYLLWTLFIILCKSGVHYYVNCGRCCFAPVFTVLHFCRLLSVVCVHSSVLFKHVLFNNAVRVEHVYSILLPGGSSTY